jgi:hypothetical protein
MTNVTVDMVKERLNKYHCGEIYERYWPPCPVYNIDVIYTYHDYGSPHAGIFYIDKNIKCDLDVYFVEEEYLHESIFVDHVTCMYHGALKFEGQYITDVYILADLSLSFMDLGISLVRAARLKYRFVHVVLDALDMHKREQAALKIQRIWKEVIYHPDHPFVKHIAVRFVHELY